MTMTDRDIFDLANQSRSSRTRRADNIPSLNKELLSEPSSPTRVLPTRNGPVSDSDDYDEDDEDSGSVYEEPSALQDPILSPRSMVSSQNGTQTVDAED